MHRFIRIASGRTRNCLEATAAEPRQALEGPLLRVALVGDNQPNRLLLVIHHPAVDGVSWRIFTRGSPASYPAQPGEAVQLPLKTTSFKQWSEFLQEYAHSPGLQQECDYWVQASRQFVSRLWIILTVQHGGFAEHCVGLLALKRRVHCYKRCPRFIGPKSTMYCSQHWCRPLPSGQRDTLLVDLEGTDEKQSQTISIYRGQSAGLQLSSQCC